jgi:hypothetical protein
MIGGAPDRPRGARRGAMPQPPALWRRRLSRVEARERGDWLALL